MPGFVSYVMTKNRIHFTALVQSSFCRVDASRSESIRVDQEVCFKCVSRWSQLSSCLDLANKFCEIKNFTEFNLYPYCFMPCTVYSCGDKWLHDGNSEIFPSSTFLQTIEWDNIIYYIHYNDIYPIVQLKDIYFSLFFNVLYDI